MSEAFHCEFCDQSPKLGNTFIGERQYFKLSCLDCHADSYPCLSVEDAVDDWNRRHGKQIVKRKAA